MRLWSWVRGLFRRPARDIFPYWDGTRRRWADPIAVHRAMEEKDKDWHGLLSALVTAQQMEGRADLSPAIRAQMGDQTGIVGELAGLVRAAFGVPPLGADGRGRPVGLTDLECLDLLTEFLVWLRDVEADHFPLLNSPSAPPSRSAADDTGEWTTGPSLPSTSPATASA
ncbi:MAG TPA: hypothetical protein VEI97_08045 [bacterium]|nr:hypothetical protein [bacterium]